MLTLRKTISLSTALLNDNKGNRFRPEVQLANFNKIKRFSISFGHKVWMLELYWTRKTAFNSFCVFDQFFTNNSGNALGNRCEKSKLIWENINKKFQIVFKLFLEFSPKRFDIPILDLWRNMGKFPTDQFPLFQVASVYIPLLRTIFPQFVSYFPHLQWGSWVFPNQLHNHHLCENCWRLNFRLHRLFALKPNAHWLREYLKSLWLHPVECKINNEQLVYIWSISLFSLTVLKHSNKNPVAVTIACLWSKDGLGPKRFVWKSIMCRINCRRDFSVKIPSLFSSKILLALTDIKYSLISWNYCTVRKYILQIRSNTNIHLALLQQNQSLRFASINML